MLSDGLVEKVPAPIDDADYAGALAKTSAC
jgi:hypothetical protein